MNEKQYKYCWTNQTIKLEADGNQFSTNNFDENNRLYFWFIDLSRRTNIAKYEKLMPLTFLFLARIVEK